MSQVVLLPIVLVVVVLLAIGLVLIRQADRTRRAAGKRPLGGSGPWVWPTVLGIVAVGWLVATLLNR